MVRALARGWRVFGAGFSFVVFGAAGIVLGVLVFPVLRVVVRDVKRREAWSRALLRVAFRLFIELMNALGVLRYSFTGRDRLDRTGLLILANHPSLIDAVFLMAFVKNADCVVDAPLGENPFTRGAVRAAGYISNEPAGLPMVEACIASLARGGNLVFFPEGTRTPPDGAIHLLRGGAQVAVRGGRDITPVIIRSVPRMLMRGQKWWQVPVRHSRYTISVGDDIPVRPFLDRSPEPAISARALNDYLQQYFSKESQAHAVA